MGQGPSSSDGEFAQLQGRLASNFDIIKIITTVTYQDLVNHIEHLNKVTRRFTDRAGKQLRFLIKKGTDSTFLWKGTIRIRCLKINTRTNVMESSRLLNLREFIVIYKEITEQVPALNLSSTGNSSDSGTNEEPSMPREAEFTASAFFPPPDKKQVDNEDPLNECCVCMDRKACIMLSCCHEFCETCIDNWTRDERHSNCPLCRTRVSGADDTWVLPETTDHHDYADEVGGYLVGLADRAGDAQKDYPLL